MAIKDVLCENKGDITRWGTECCVSCVRFVAPKCCVKSGSIAASVIDNFKTFYLQLKNNSNLKISVDVNSFDHTNPLDSPFQHFTLDWLYLALALLCWVRL